MSGSIPRLVLLFASLLLTWQSAEAEPRHRIQLKAGDADLAPCPVRLVLADPGSVQIRLGQKEIPCQVTALGLEASTRGKTESTSKLRELHFVAPAMRAGETVTLDVIPTSEPAKNEGFQFVDTPGKHRELRFKERPVLRYMYEPLDESTPQRRMETYKVYHHVFDPTGTRLLTKGPGGLYPHHRGIYFGFNRIQYGDKRADVWHCNRGESQAHIRIVDEAAGPLLGRQQLEIEWRGQDGKTFVRERRELTAFEMPGGQLIEFVSRLTSEAGDVRLDGDPQHAGVQFRATQHVPDKTRKQTYYLRPDGPGKPGVFRNWPNQKTHADLPWNAMSFVVDDTRYTCCYLDREQNPKPARFSERDYGRFGSYFPYTLKQEKPLIVKYRFWVQEGEMDVPAVESLHRSFTTPPKATQIATAVD